MFPLSQAAISGDSQNVVDDFLKAPLFLIQCAILGIALRSLALFESSFMQWSFTRKSVVTFYWILFCSMFPSLCRHHYGALHTRNPIFLAAHEICHTAQEAVIDFRKQPYINLRETFEISMYDKNECNLSVN